MGLSVLLQSTPLLDLAAWLVTASLKGTVLIAVVVLLRHLLASATTSIWRHALWLPVLACLICPLGPRVSLRSSLPASLTASVMPTPTTPNVVPGVSVMDRVTGDRLLQPAAPVGAQHASSAYVAREQAESAAGTAPGALLRVLIIIWAAGVLALALLYPRNLVRFRRLRLAARAVGTTSGGVFQSCKEELRVRRTVTLLESADIQSPTVVGWYRPVILLPLGLDMRLDATRLRLVLLHELAHVKRGDVLFSWITAIAQVLHWFNPAVWLAGRLMRADMESASDALVLSRLSRAERGAYGNMLVHLADSDAGWIPSRHGLGIADRQRDLRARILMIAHFRPASGPAKLATGLALATFTAVALLQPTLSSPLAATQAAQSALAAAPTGQQRLLYEQSRPQRQVPFNPSSFDEYAGYYWFADTSLFARVFRTAGRYYVQVTGKGPVEVFPESSNEFFATVVPAQLTFRLGDSGRVTELALHQAGYLQVASRVSRALHESAAVRLQQRIAGNSPSPGTRTSLRRQLQGWESAAPDYADMGAALASASRGQREQMRTMIRYLGAFKRLDFVSVAPNGWDDYTATFANGTVKCLVAPLSSDGKVTALFYVP
jgi:beta-lactamase regulating signal transducer with metallopeptidase domain